VDSFVFIDDEMFEPESRIFDMKGAIKVSNEYEGKAASETDDFNFDDFIPMDELSVGNMKEAIKIVQGSEVEQVKPITVKVDTSNVVQEFLEKHVQPIQKGIQKGIKTQMNDRVKPSIKKVGKNFQASIDEHVVPQLDKVGKELDYFRSNSLFTIEKIGTEHQGSFRSTCCD